MNIDKTNIDSMMIYKVVYGSHAYGFATEKSDLDIRGICVPPKEYFISADKRFDQLEYSENDTVIYNIQKYIKLAMDCNPSVLELLFINNPEHILVRTKYSDMLKANRQLFLSKKIRWTFSGYAYSQLHRLQSHRAWLLKPVDHMPTRSEFGLSEEQTEIFSNTEIGAINKLLKGEFEQIVANTGVEEEFMNEVKSLNGKLANVGISHLMEGKSNMFGKEAIRLVQKENEYQRALQYYNQYENWKANRNKERAELEAKFGMDCKFSSHLIRLLREGVEILETGTLQVERSDAAELLAIRNGAWSIDKVIGYAKEMDNKMKELYDSDKCAVPHTNDRNKINQLCCEIIEEYWDDNQVR